MKNNVEEHFPNSMEHVAYREGFLCLNGPFREPSVHYHIHKSPPMTPILSHMTPLLSITAIFKVNLNISLPSARSQTVSSFQVSLLIFCLYFSIKALPTP
jgi:hypothetical protein